MKKLVFALLLSVMTLTVSANEIRYFTYAQASRAVECLDHVTELLIYCGYADEIETYCLVSEVWAEKVNSKYYEIWLYGWDAYTGDEIYMPIDMSCIWLYSGSHYYSAATYLRFVNNKKAPNFGWHMPVYNAFDRRMHPVGMSRSYHYDVHCHGWHHTAWDEHHPHNLPPYYSRPHTAPAPAPTHTWTPGHDKPIISSNGHNYIGSQRTTQTAPTTTTTAPSTSRSNGTVNNNSSNSRGTATNTSNGSTPRVVTSSSRTSNTSTGTTSRGNTNNSGTSTSSSRGTSTSSSSSSSRNSSGTSTSSSSSRSNGSSASGSRTSSTNTSGTTTSRTSTNTKSTTNNSRTATTNTNSTTKR